jgi:hypothetical protein
MIGTRLVMVLLVVELLQTVCTASIEDETMVIREKRAGTSYNPSADLNDFREVLYVVIGLVIVGVVVALLVYVFCCGRR